MKRTLLTLSLLLVACGPGVTPTAPDSNTGTLEVPAALTLTAEAGTSVDRNLSLVNTTRQTITYQVKSDVPWLQFSPTAGQVASGSGVALSVSAQCAAATGVQRGTVLVSGTFAAQVPVTLTCTPAAIQTDTTPDVFTFPPVLGVEPGSQVTSAEVTVTGINAPAPVAVQGGILIVNGQMSGATTVHAGDRIALRVQAGNGFTQATSATLSIGGVSAAFEVTTRADVPADTTPDPFTLGTINGVTPDVDIASAEITVAGITVPTPISVQGGVLILNDQVSTSTTVRAGDRVAVRVRSSVTPGETREATLTIGGVSAVFRLITHGTTPLPPADTTPDPFAFTSTTGAAPGSEVTSATVTLSGMNAPAPVSVEGGTLIVNGQVSGARTLQAGDRIALRVTASSEEQGLARATITVGSYSTTYTVQSRGPLSDTDPDSFSFLTVTDAEPGSKVLSSYVTVTGINAPAPVSVEGGRLIINGLAGSATTVRAGDQVALEVTASTTLGARQTARLSIGYVSATFSVQTRAFDDLPDPFLFPEVTNAEPGTEVWSAPVTLSGIEGLVSASISGGGTLYVDGVANAKQAAPGSVIRIRTTAPELGAAQTSTIRLGRGEATFIVRASAPDMLPDPFVVPPKDWVEPGALTRTAAFTVTGFNMPVPMTSTDGITVWRGGFPVMNGDVVRPGDTLIAEVRASFQYGAEVRGSIRIGGITAPVSVTTRPFAFPSVTGASPMQRVRSTPITLAGLGPLGSGITLTDVRSPFPRSNNAQAYVDGQPVTSGTRVYDGQSLVIELTTDEYSGETVSTRVDVGSYSAEFQVRNAGPDRAPDSVLGDSINDQRISEIVTGREITLSGITEDPLPVVIRGYQPDTFVEINGTRYTQTQTINGTLKVQNGDRIRIVQQTSSRPYDGKASTVHVGDRPFYLSTRTVTEQYIAYDVLAPGQGPATYKLYAGEGEKAGTTVRAAIVLPRPSAPGLMVAARIPFIPRGGFIDVRRLYLSTIGGASILGTVSLHGTRGVYNTLPEDSLQELVLQIDPAAHTQSATRLYIVDFNVDFRGDDVDFKFYIEITLQ